jgi:uncharacterized membrane protein YeaQ/YmgE (transglycosylase-associated protein family)
LERPLALTLLEERLDGHRLLIVLGLIAGSNGRRLSIAKCKVSWLDIALGIIGALVGGFLFDLFGTSGVGGLNITA